VTALPLHRPAAWRRTWPWSLAVVLSLALLGPEAGAAPEPTEAPRDPNDAPMMRPPNGQPVPVPIKATPALAPRYGGDRRFALTLSPAYASFRLPLLGRPTIRRPGVGALLEADLRLLSFVWLRAQVGYTGHPMDESKSQDEDSGDVSVIANAGTLHTTTAGVGLAIGVDLGRFLPTIDVGAGVFRIGMPEGAMAGQRGLACVDGTTCDTGLTCRAGTCVPAPVPEVHAGVAIDVMLAKRWYIGASMRYFALMVAPREYPVYLIGALRLGARF